MKKRIIPFLLLLICLLLPFGSVSVLASTKTVTVTLAKKKRTKKISLYVGDKIKIKAKNGKKTAKASSLKYKSSKKSIASVSKKGVVTLKKAGTASITITTKNKKKKASIKVTVKKKQINYKPTVIYSYRISASSITIKEGNSRMLSVLKTPGNTKVSGVSWSTSNPDVATVNGGKVYGIEEGRATIYARIDGHTYSCRVTVESAFEESTAISKIRYWAYDSGKGVAVVVQNNYDYDLNLRASLVFKSASGTMLQSRSDSNYCLEAGQRAVLWFSPPYDENYSDVAYSSFSISFNAEKASAISCGINGFSVNSTPGSGNVTAEITNNSGETASTIRASCLFFDMNGSLIGIDECYPDCKNPGSTDYVSFDYPHDEHYDTITPATYEIFINEAYYYSWQRD